MNDRSCETYNAKDVIAPIEQNECVRVELEKVKQHYNELYDSIKISLWQFCDFDLEIAFGKHSCFVHDMNGIDLLKGSRSTNLYTISIDDMMKSSLVCLLSKASKIKSWLWHHRLNHLNFGPINDLAQKDLVRGFPRLKFEKDHLCSAYQHGKSKEKYSHITQNLKTQYGSSSYPSHGFLGGLMSSIRVIASPKLDIGIFVGLCSQRKGFFDLRPKVPVSNNGKQSMSLRCAAAVYGSLTRVDEPVPSATVVNAQVVPPGTSVSTTFAQDAPSTSYSPSSFGIQPPVIHHDVAVGPTIEDTPITQATLHPSVNPVTGEPSSA
ncbi:integrase, catalytic region, zinc finger, CCHC-type containing protein [Tanacetum coccineum]